MEKPNLLYICINDGSDMRVVKEVKTLAKENNVVFLAIGKRTCTSFALSYCSRHYFVEGKHKSPITIIRFAAKLVSLLIKQNFESVHVVDEQLYVFICPLLMGRRVVLDVFDSMFLKLDKPNESLHWIKRIIYSSVRNIIVTDENRAMLLPDFAKKKAVVIPNVPPRIQYGRKVSNPDYLTLCYFGSLARSRGSEFALSILESNHKIRLLAAGWVRDRYTRDMLKHPRVEYLGVLRQDEANRALAERGDYLLAIYPYSNLNNIYASPNKIYDSIHTRTPIIINREIRVSEFVEKSKIGYVVTLEKMIDFSALADTLIKKRDSYQFSDELISKYCWESYEDKLLGLHDQRLRQDGSESVVN